MSGSQSQESTQQPSIEVKPRVPSTHFKTPLSAVAEAYTNAEGDRTVSTETESSQDGIVNEGTRSLLDTSIEESTEDLNWTQTQILQNGMREAERKDEEREELVPGSSATTHRTSPEAQISVAAPENRPHWAAAPTSRPSTPYTEGDELDDSIPLGVDLEVNLGSDVIPDPEPESTEVDMEPPEVPTPENSQTVSDPSPLPKTASRRSAPVVHTKTNGHSTNSPHLSPISKWTPSRHARMGILGGVKRRAVSPFASPFKPASSISTSRRGKRSQRSETPKSDDSSFGKDPAPPKDSRAPVVRLTEIMNKSTEIMLTTSKGDGFDDEMEHAKSDDPERPLGRASRITGIEEEEEEKLESFKNGFKRHVDSVIKAGGFESEESDDDLDWNESLRRSGEQHNSGKVIERPSSPTPVRHPNASSGLSVSPEAPGTTDPANSANLKSPRGTSPEIPLSTSKPSNGRMTRRFNHFASSSTTSPGPNHVLSQLFSSQGQHDDISMNDSTQRSTFLQATQMVAQPASPPISQGAHAALDALVGDLEPTQPDDEVQAPIANGDLASKTAQRNGAPVARTTLAPTVSTASTTTSSKLDIPAHRQLQRRSRTEDDPPLLSPRGVIHNIRASLLTPVIEPPSSERLQASRSEPSLQNAATSSPRGSSPVHRYSSLPLVDGAIPPLQESNIQPPPASQEEVVIRAPLNKRKATRIVLSQASSPPLDSTSSPLQSTALNFGSQRRIAPAAVNTATLEQTLTDEPTLLIPPLPKPTTPKRYKGPVSWRRQAVSGPPEPVHLSPRARKRYTPESDDSSSAPADTEDHSYRPKVKAARKDKEESRRAKRQSKKRSRSAVSSPLSEAAKSDGESSSAPEDPEDNTYQPTLSPSKDIKGKRGAKVADGNGQITSRAPLPKKIKLTLNAVEDDPPRLEASLSSDTSSIRVFAQWDRQYYPAAIIGRTGNTFKILYDDGDEKSGLPADKIRQMRLKKGDVLLRAIADNVIPLKFEVEQDWEGGENGVMCCHEGQSIGPVPIGWVRIPIGVIKERFNDRLFGPAAANVSAPPNVSLAAPSRQTSASRSPIRATHRSTGKAGTGTSTRSASPFVRTASTNLFETLIFLITAGSNDRNVDRNMTPEQSTTLIQENGGTTVTNWEDMFDVSPSGMVTPVFRNMGAGSRRTPFLIPMGRVILTPKFMVALAKGIPCLSLQFILDSVEAGKVVDWRSYLVTSGPSMHTGQEMSQTVDMNWGEATWDARQAAHLRTPLKAKKVLFVQPKGNLYAYLKTLAPVCLSALGVAELKSVTQSSTAERDMLDRTWDYIVVERRGNGGVPKVLKNDERVCDMTWLKQCLIMGTALPPSLHDQ